MNAIRNVTLASILASAGCDASGCRRVPVVSELLKTVHHLKDIDSEFEPALETKLEQQYNIQILGKPEFLTEIALGETQRVLQNLFDPSQINGVTFVWGNVGLGAGVYNSNFFGLGPFCFIKNPQSENPQSEDRIIVHHEVMHHLHYSQPEKILNNFNKEWGNIEIIIPNEEGVGVVVTTKEATAQLKRFGVKGLDPLLGWGLFGHIFSYSLKVVSNDEDVAAYGEFILQVVRSNATVDQELEVGRIAYWDPFFSPDPYLAKLDLIEEYHLLKPEAVQAARTHLLQQTNYFTPFRESQELISLIPVDGVMMLEL